MNTPDYDSLVAKQRDQLFHNIEHRMSTEEMNLIRAAYEFAHRAHAEQTRKTGEPYITHPIAVARIVAEELMLGSASIAAAFLHDVVEDTPATIEDIRQSFGDEVAFLVQVVTKVKKPDYEMSKQLDNFKQMLDSIHYDIRALLIKLSDRLHNMRTLSSMKPTKQMKITSETDYFYAPLANRLGLYDIKSELENLSLRFRSPQEYERIEQDIEGYMECHREYIAQFIAPIQELLRERDIQITITPKIRSVYALWRKMEGRNLSFRELEHIYILNVTFPFDEGFGYNEKGQALRLYSLISDIYRERPASLVNYIDSPKENGYQSLHCQFMCQHGTWVELHISSDRMVYNSKLGCVADRSQGVAQWVDRFKATLQDIAFHGKEGGFIEDVVSAFYQDDIVVFTPQGAGVVLPKGSSAIDFAYEIHTNIGNKAKYARVNGKLCPVITTLKRGDRVEIGTDEAMRPRPEWMQHVVTYKAKKGIQNALRRTKAEEKYFAYWLCSQCHPLPGDEVVGFQTHNGKTEVHKRNCPQAISLSAQAGDSIKETLLPKLQSHCYSTAIKVTGIDRNGLLLDLMRVISEELGLNITDLRITTEHEIVYCSMQLKVTSVNELMKALSRIEKIPGVEGAKRIMESIRV